ncbi:MAG: bifunctional 23S rRNA (guanine(2069)-N(7))-methyltransferase RlmK/23S rRNA (guanine(2445)-N(2))-methyltransferase RlmL [Desulfuromonas sp.]|nr:MAG: bifunctional 23S rRNA (guanine(2069)-N(7))-methyltransferase RlmK/23S rRNA (guanine(2445)-N(2))-methyltransferase RlmL [Desulfuromonas sp.]
MDTTLNFFATASKGLEPLLAQELEDLSASSVQQARGGVHFSGSLETAYRVCLWSRLAGRVFLPLVETPVNDTEELYQAVVSFPWEEHFDVSNTFAVDCNLVSSQITHSRYAALKAKDGIVDRFRDLCGGRPDVDVRQPDWRLNVWILKDVLTLSLDLSGDSLHRRGYRTQGGRAPLKEHLAAALLIRAGWPQLAAEKAPLVDPMCGSGTLVLEAALMAGDCAPGLMRDYMGFLHWHQHDADLWLRLKDEASQRREAGLQNLPRLVGFDRDAAAIKNAWENATNAGLQDKVHFERRDLSVFGDEPVADKPGLIITNPPYGERLGEVEALLDLYAMLGQLVRDHFQHWQLSVFTSGDQFGPQLGMRIRKKHQFFNGALKCQLLHFDVEPENFYRDQTALPHGMAPVDTLSDGAQMFVNRLRKNLKRLRRWAKKNHVTCYRVYDADLPDYAVAIDLYEGAAHVQEYQAPATVDSRTAKRRLREIITVLPQELGIAPEQVYVKTRQRQRGHQQYERQGEQGAFFEVSEGGNWFLVNLNDYLDTGLFLDHRLTRDLVRSLAGGEHFLNLFAYTGSVSVYAAAGGALSTTTVDMSTTYTQWAEKNMALNGFTGPQHRIIRADCLQWIKQCPDTFDMIFLDPPTFSNSKKMASSFDIQRDHVDLIYSVAQLLSKGGVLIFSNNLRNFKMDREQLADLQIEDISRQTIPEDFSRRRNIHNCWKIEWR